MNRIIVGCLALVCFGCVDEKLVPIERAFDMNADPCLVWNGTNWINPKSGMVVVEGELVGVCREATPPTPGPTPSFEEGPSTNTGNDAGAPDAGGATDAGTDNSVDAGVVGPGGLTGTGGTNPVIPTVPDVAPVLPPLPEIPDTCTAVQVCVNEKSQVKCTFDHDAKKACQEECKAIRGKGRGQCEQDCIRANRQCDLVTECKAYRFYFVCQ